MPTSVLDTTLRPGGWLGVQRDKSLSKITRLHPLHPLIRSAPASTTQPENLLPNQQRSYHRSSLSILSNHAQCESSQSATADYVFKNHDSYRKICDWFDSWRDWQKRILICGITNRLVVL